MNEANNNGLYPLFHCCFALILADCDWDLDLHAIWQECSGIPTPPPCLATDFQHPRQILSDDSEPAGYETSGSSSIECFFHPTCDNLSAFKWTGPDPLSMSTQASDLFLHMSALAFPKGVFWIEFRLVRFDWKSGATTEEHLFFLPRVETATWNLRRVRGQLLDAISWHGFGATGTSFRLSLWPRMKPLQYSSQSALSRRLNDPRYISCRYLYIGDFKTL
ncbi:uncharacterized protein N7529_003458 [Penicillium soppii]|uniref:uncharacterized protein n=1 Tax=Penicillium soppii TaxID=69789 RepID=UPI00254711F2|nr:uncharacterized protein N7529_003458 [Penicillium soppii]KAJ5871105.1 hypothetical protein N7529_003458 [Penicillium soppii]